MKLTLLHQKYDNGYFWPFLTAPEANTVARYTMDRTLEGKVEDSRTGMIRNDSTVAVVGAVTCRFMDGNCVL